MLTLFCSYIASLKWNLLQLNMILKVEVYAVVLALNQSWNWTDGTRTGPAIYSDINSVKTYKIFFCIKCTQNQKIITTNHLSENWMKNTDFLLAFSVSQGWKFFPSPSIFLRRVNSSLVYPTMDQALMKLDR